MRYSVLQIAICCALLSTTPASAEDDSWSGLYKGLDALDGSIDYLSISRTDSETYELRIVPSVISLCTTGHGWIVAEGTLDGTDRMLRRNSRVYCEGEEPRDIDDRVLMLDRDAGIIRYGATDNRRPLIYHRVSTN